MDTETNANAVKEKCSGCIVRISKDHGKLGCKYCDEYWDCPDLTNPDTETNDEIEWEADKEKCSGCVKRILGDGLKLGCMYCDENWDCPELTHY